MNFEKHGELFKLEKRVGHKGLALSHYSPVLNIWRRMNRVSSKSEAIRMIDAQYATRTGAFADASFWDTPENLKRAFPSSAKPAIVKEV